MAFDDFSEDTEFKFITRLQQAKGHAEDMHRFNRAMSGLETGDGNAHNSKSKDKAADAQRKGKSSGLRKLDEWLLNPEYEALYNRFGDLLSGYETATETALGRAENALAELLDRAAHLPDARAVFRDENGNVVTEDGSIIDPETAVAIQWPDDAPTYKDYLKRKQDLDELRRYQIDVLGEARERYENPDDPMTAEEIEQRMKEIQEQAPQQIEAELKPDEVVNDGQSKIAFSIQQPPLSEL